MLVHLLLLLSSAFAEVPARPVGFIHDPQSVLPIGLANGLSKVLEEHESLSRESVFVVIAATAEKDPSARATEIFDGWKRETREPTSAVLLYLQLREEHAELRAGLGLEGFLSQFSLERMTRNILKRELAYRAEDGPQKISESRAVVLSVLEVLHGLDSPTEEGNHDQLLLREAGFPGEFAVRPLPQRFPYWVIGLVVGLLGFVYAIAVALSAEAHYSGEGWVHTRRWYPRSWRKFTPRGRRLPKLITGGGVSGHY